MAGTITVTVLFTDIVGNTALRQRMGDAAFERALQAHNRLIREQISRNDGREVKTIGDSFMVAFASARKAVDCAVAIQAAFAARNRGNPDRSLHVRIGINAGEAAEDDGDLSGTAVNAAKYIEGKAEPDQILVSETVRALIGPVSDLEFVDRGRFRLKGMPERWRLYETAWKESPVVRPALAERTPFVGRENECAFLSGLLERVRFGTGALVMIGGEPGVGKTRLAEELMTEGRSRGMFSLIGHCYETEAASPYIPFLEAIEYAMRILPPETLANTLGESASEVARLVPEVRQLLPETPAPIELPPGEGRRYLFKNVREYLERASRRQPIVLVLDDLHWADEPTLLLLENLALRLHEIPMLVIGTYRDVEMDLARPLARTLEAFTRRGLAERLVLRRFSKTETAAMLRGMSGQEPPLALVDVIQNETEGVPFFIQEVYQHLTEEQRLLDANGRWRPDVRIGEVEVPESVLLVVGRRLERVGEETRRILAAASIIGRAFSFELLEALIHVDEDTLLDAVDEAERAHLIVSDEGRQARFTFAHEQIRQTLLHGLSLPRRQRMHLRVAEAIEKAYAECLNEHASELAHHLYQAGAAADPEKTARYLALAGRQAFATAAFEDAVELFNEALLLLGDDQPRERAALLFEKGLAVRSLGHWDTELDDWREALSIYENLGDVEAVGHLCYEMAKHLGWAARVVESAEMASRGLSVLGQAVSADRCLLLAMAGAAESWAPLPIASHSRAEETLAGALAMARQIGDDVLEGQVLRSKAIHDSGWCHFKDVIADGRGAALLRANVWDAVDLDTWVSNVLLYTGRWDEGHRLLNETESRAERIGQTSAQWMCMCPKILLGAWRTGDLPTMEKALRSVISFSEQHAVGWSFYDHTYLGLALFGLGRWDEARAEVSIARAHEKVSAVSDGAASGVLLLLNAYEGQRRETLEILGQYHDRLMSAGPLTLGLTTVAGCAIEGLAVLGELDAAAALYERAKQLSDAGLMLWFAPLALQECILGIAAACGQRWDLSGQHFDTALRQARELPDRLAEPEALRWKGWMLLHRDAPGDRDTARDLLSDAAGLYRSLAMSRHADLAERLLATT